MGEPWKQLISYLGSFTVLVAALSYLCKTLFKQFLDRDLDHYKHELTMERERQASERTRELEAFKGQLQQSLESYKAQLQLTNKEQEIRFVKLHEKRAAFLADLYEQLEYLGQRADEVTAFIMREGMIPEKQDEIREVLHQGTEIASFVKKNKLYFSKNLARQVEEFVSKLSAPSDQRLLTALLGDLSSYGQSIRHGVLAWRSEFGPIQAEALQTIEREFRIMLGSEPEGDDESASTR